MQASGYRAAEAFIRPSPIFTSGNLTSYGFDLRRVTFTCALECDSPTTEEGPTEIFLPAFHFPRDHTEVQVSGGKWTLSFEGVDDGVNDVEKDAMIQKLRWWHGEGSQHITVKGVARPPGSTSSSPSALSGADEENGYYEQCQSAKCVVM